MSAAKKTPTKDPRGGAGRGQGRKPLVEGGSSVVIQSRCTPEHRDKFHALGGGGWLRRQIDSAMPSQKEEITRILTELSPWWRKRLHPDVLNFDAKSVVGRRCIELCARADAMASLMSAGPAIETVARAVDMQCTAWCLA